MGLEANQKKELILHSGKDSPVVVHEVPSQRAPQGFATCIVQASATGALCGKNLVSEKAEKVEGEKDTF